MKRAYQSRGNKLMAQANVLFAIANVITSINHAFHPSTELTQAQQIQALRAENLQLKNKNELVRNGRELNNVLKGDLEIELLNLKIAREKWEQRNAGITSSSFTARNYSEPGDVRHGQS